MCVTLARGSVSGTLPLGLEPIQSNKSSATDRQATRMAVVGCLSMWKQRAPLLCYSHADSVMAAKSSGPGRKILVPKKVARSQKPEEQWVAMLSPLTPGDSSGR